MISRKCMTIGVDWCDNLSIFLNFTRSFPFLPSIFRNVIEDISLYMYLIILSCESSNKLHLTLYSLIILELHLWNCECSSIYIFQWVDRKRFAALVNSIILLLYQLLQYCSVHLPVPSYLRLKNNSMFCENDCEGQELLSFPSHK